MGVYFGSMDRTLLVDVGGKTKNMSDVLVPALTGSDRLDLAISSAKKPEDLAKMTDNFNKLAAPGFEMSSKTFDDLLQNRINALAAADKPKGGPSR